MLLQLAARDIGHVTYFDPGGARARTLVVAVCGSPAYLSDQPGTTEE